jgi:hypothetical protein
MKTMHRRDISKALFAAAAGSAVVAQRTEAQTCSAPCFAQTTAEIAAGVTPVNYAYLEGDIRRYGALPGSSNVAAAINSALAVSTAGGAAAYIPGTTTQWNITQTLVANGGCSMHGDGQASLIVCTGCDGITFGPQGFFANSRFFANFVLEGSSPTSSQNNGISFGAALGAGRVTGVLFSNLSILNFAKAVYINNPTGLWESAFSDCNIYNCYQGYYFNGQAIGIQIRGGFVQCGTAMTGSGVRYGVCAATNGGGDVQALNMVGVGVYAYDVSVSLYQALYSTITDCNLNIYNICGIQLEVVQGGTFIKGCWIQAAANTNNLIGIDIIDIGTAINDKIVIDACQLEGQTGTGTGALGIYCGENNTGISILNSTIGTVNAPFANGVGGIGGNIQAPNVVVKFNTFYVVTGGACVSVGNSDGVNCEVGPNVYLNGIPVAFGTTAATPAGFRFFAPGMKGTATFASSTSVAVTIPTMPNADYFISLAGSSSASFVWWLNKTTTGFVIDSNAATSSQVDWSISYY